MNILVEKIKIMWIMVGFDFLGWYFKVLGNGKYCCVLLEDNYEKFCKKIKVIVNNFVLVIAVKVKKLILIVRGWRNYYCYCKMDGLRFNLWLLNYSIFVKFKKDKNKGKEEAVRFV